MLDTLQAFNDKYSYYAWLLRMAMTNTTIFTSVLMILDSLGFGAVAAELLPNIFGALTFLIAYSLASMWLVRIGVFYSKNTSDIAIKAGIASMTLSAVLYCVSIGVTYYLVFFVSSMDTLPRMKQFLFSWNESIFYTAMVLQFVDALLFGAILCDEIVPENTTSDEKTE